MGGGHVQCTAQGAGHSEYAESVASSEEDGDPWDAYTSLPTVRMIHKGGLLPPVLAHATPHNLSEDESLEPVTICGPGWHAPLDKRPSRGQRTLEQKTQMSFPGVQFFFGNVVPPNLASGSLADQGDFDNFKSNKPSEDDDAPFIVS
ncbi:uncharacterized protein LOC125947179 [Dermacentor silvarum]|uniref:uncharacterized protein LOC125947179 n=1 Tax=Dermacentor silvarum TaxID=543639 RepID=UPI00210079B2|nr:uncharacterized protein LOC125947179 [Dermacentor silvarum]